MTIKTRTLKPCPFHVRKKAIGIIEILPIFFQKRGYAVACVCGARGPRRETRVGAIAAWNRRAELRYPVKGKGK